MPWVVPTATASRSTSTLDVNSFASATLTVAARWPEASELLMMLPTLRLYADAQGPDEVDDILRAAGVAARSAHGRNQSSHALKPAFTARITETGVFPWSRAMAMGMVVSAARNLINWPA
jgi:hypothetical protein